ncbi:unnamed protein product [Calypogeia fissa]
MVDVVQKCAHLIEALNNAQPDAKVFRNHCLEVSSCTNQLLPQLVNAQKELPDLGNAPGASEVFNKLNAAMEEALTLLRKCATMSKLDKMMDQGLSFVNEQKTTLQSQLPPGLVPAGLMPKNIVPEGLMQGLSKTIFGEQGPPSGDTKQSLVSIMEELKKSTQAAGVVGLFAALVLELDIIWDDGSSPW